MKLVYLGSPEAAVGPLEVLVAAGHEVLLVVSQPDRKRGRGAALLPSPVKACALRLGLPISAQPNEVLDAVANGAELGVVVAYGRIIKPVLLEALPFVNLHFSLLPRWRGAAPVERAVLAGDTETGVCLMALEVGLDTGPVYRRVVTPIEAHESVSALRARLVAIGTDMLVDALARGPLDATCAEAQVGEVTYAAKLDPAEALVDWSRPALSIERLTRVGTAWTTFRGKRLKILRAEAEDACGPDEANPAGTILGGRSMVRVATGEGMLRVLLVQPEGKASMDAIAWRNGVHPHALERLGT